MRGFALSLSIFLVASLAWSQQAPGAANAAPSSYGSMRDMPGDMPGMDMSGHGMGAGEDQDMSAEPGNDAAMHSMEGHMDMGPHMKMTALRPAKPGDSERARKIEETARQVCQKYIDYKTALADGFKIFLPNVPQRVYHFTNYKYGWEAQRALNPEHPTSLLYEKQGEGYKLVGVMYTAPRILTEEQLDQRIPLSFAQWHQHVNFCVPPRGRRLEMLEPHSKFGMNGSIATREACDAEGGKFYPVVLNWMVHVYPFEKDQASVWSTDRQHGDAD